MIVDTRLYRPWLELKLARIHFFNLVNQDVGEKDFGPYVLHLQLYCHVKLIVV